MVKDTAKDTANNAVKDTPKDKDYTGYVCLYDGGEVIYNGLVVGMDRDLGITIVNHDDKDDYLCCINGPMHKEYDPTCYWDDIYDYIADCIEDEEVIDASKAVYLYHGEERIPSGNSVDASKCSFI